MKQTPTVPSKMPTEHQQYQYGPLDVSRNEIRILRLAPSRSFGAKVVCNLVHCSLDDKTSYEALSYTWGDSTLRRSIFLDGRKFLVTRNLEIALRHLRYVRDERILWIDALCINQGDTSECNEQVSKMGRIYQRATKVVAWLGEASGQSDVAIDFLVKAAAKRLEIDQWLPELWDNRNCLREWRSLSDLLERDYWKRVWIVQEIFFGASVIVRCGFRCIRWSDFVFLLYCMTKPNLMANTGSLLERISGNFEFFRLYPLILDKGRVLLSIEECIQDMKEIGLDRLPLELLLTRYRPSLSSNPLDKVFAMSSMAKQYDDNSAITIDYALSKRDTYIKTAQYLIERRKHSNLSPLNIIYDSFPHFSDPDLPSWVPDWSSMPHFINIETQYYPFKASGFSGSESSFEIRQEVLIVQGFEVDTVGHLQGHHSIATHYPSSGPVQVSPSNERELAIAILETLLAANELAMSNSKNLPHSHRSVKIRREEFVRTLLLNLMPSSSTKASIMLEEEVQMYYEQLELCIKFADRWEDVMANRVRGIDGSFYGIFPRNLIRYKFGVSSSGMFLMAPAQTCVGDIVCVILGCDMPVVLRKTEENHYVFVGDCYAHGIMEGETIEALAAGKYKATELHIH